MPRIYILIILAIAAWAAISVIGWLIWSAVG